MSRRRALGLLGVAGAAVVGVAEAVRSRGRIGPRPQIVAGTTRSVERYGEQAHRTGEWWLPPAAGPRPTVVLVHGGYWRPGYDRHLEDAVAADLAGRGYLVWNIDYSPSSRPWPATLADVAAGYDHTFVGEHAARVDRDRVAVVGHSAGGQLALWLAGRPRIGPSEVGTVHPGYVVPALAVGQAPVAALTLAAQQGLGGGAVAALLGGTPAQVPLRYAVADPVALLPTGIRTVLIHGRADTAVPFSQSEAYLAAATAAGGSCRLAEVPGDHFVHLDPRTEAVARLREALDRW
ncbi:MAG TPA: alpha/beta hydrolase [Mycobacteriales bacterium]|nr:alpha/beta hydrolase [Mycobacteriales bacterium]